MKKLKIVALSSPTKARPTDPNYVAGQIRFAYAIVPKADANEFNYAIKDFLVQALNANNFDKNTQGVARILVGTYDIDTLKKSIADKKEIDVFVNNRKDLAGLVVYELVEGASYAKNKEVSDARKISAIDDAILVAERYKSLTGKEVSAKDTISAALENINNRKAKSVNGRTVSLASVKEEAEQVKKSALDMK